MVDEIIDDSWVIIEEIVCNMIVEKCIGDDDICNGIVIEGVEVVDYGNGFIKDMMVMNVVI